MRITIDIKPSAHTPSVTEISSIHLKIAVHAPPHDGRANEEMIEMLAEHFGVAKSRFRIVSGKSSRRKIVSYE